MAGITITITGDERLLAHWGNVTRRRQVLIRGFDLATLIIHRAVGITTPIGVTSILANSWATDTLDLWPRIFGIVGTPIEYASVMERGRTAGARMPPPDAIATWVARKLGPDVSPFVVARSIGRKGIEGREMLLHAIDDTRPAWTGVIRASVRQMVEG
jgi:hypothetical protein